MSIATVPGSAAIRAALSEPRVSTYLAATDGDLDRALALYAWNARVSAALLVPAHYAEVLVRNAVSEALTEQYGSKWPWSVGFERSLPVPPGGFKPVVELRGVRARHVSTGKVVAELKFVFWQMMFTARHDQRLWKPQLHRLFPHAADGEVAMLRARIYGDLDVVRRVRNRMAHHEPLFERPLEDDLRRMVDLAGLRCAQTGAWVRSLERVSVLLRERPL